MLTPKHPPIDLDRGVTQMLHTKLGMMVCAYCDDPGLYYAPNGYPVSAEVAAEAGFDVAADAKARERKKRLADAASAIDAEFGVIAENEVVAEDAEVDLRVIHAGYGWFNVVDAQGAPLNDKRLRQDEAVAFMNMLKAGKEHADGKTAQGR